MTACRTARRSAVRDEQRDADKRTSLPTFYRQVVAELRKVVWPTQEQLVTYFLVVMVFVVFMMALVSVLDLAFGKLVFAVFAGGSEPVTTRAPARAARPQHPRTSDIEMTEQHVSEQYDSAEAEATDHRSSRRATRPRRRDDHRRTAEAVDVAAGAEDADVDDVADEADAEAVDAVRRASRTRRPTTSPTSDDPLEAFRRELWAKPGDWFVVHTYSGMENRVKSNLENRIISLNMEDYIHEIVVPTEEVAEIKNGQRKMVKRTVLPGYVLVRMDLTDESWAAVRHTPSVTGFVGHSHQPVPLSMTEVENMLAPAVVARAEAEAVAAGAAQPSGCDRRQEAGRGRRLRRVRLGHGGRRPVRHAARDDHRDQRRVPEGQGPRRDLRPGDPGRAELQPDPEGLSRELASTRQHNRA